MGIVVDANVLKDYFEVTVNNATTSLTSDPSEIFRNAGQDYVIFLDEDGHIEHEWRTLLEPEWFTNWLAERFQDGSIEEIDTENFNPIIRHLHRNLSFPRSRDIWYIRVSKTVADLMGESYLITEDIDFFDPRWKAHKGVRRIKILTERLGRVLEYLDGQDINVNCVQCFRNFINS